MHASNARPLLVALLALGLAGCSTVEDEPVTFPTITGNKVIYIADADSDDASTSGDEAYVADTGSLTQTVTRIDGGLSLGYYGDQPGAIGTAGPFVYRVVRDPLDGCPSEYKLLDFAGGLTVTFFNTHCVHAYASNAAGDRMVVMATLGDGSDGTGLFVTDPSDLSVVVQIDAGAGASVGSVSQFAVSPTGNTVVWADATGIHTADLSLALGSIVATAISTDTPTFLFPTPDGLSVIYAKDDEEQYKLQPLAGGAPTYLTNPLALSDLIGRFADDVRLSPDGSALLYTVSITGVKQLMMVEVASPLGEVRADSAGSALLQTGYSFEFSPDSASYAWTGDAGGGSQVFASTVASPGTIVALTPGSEEPTGAIRWTDNSTVAYVSSDADQVTPIGASALRTVDVATPGTTLLMGPDETAGFFVGQITTCSDGTLVFDLRYDDVDGAHTALFTADALVAASAVAISPEIIAPSDEIFDFTCVD